MANVTDRRAYALFERLNKPGASKLLIAARQQGIPLTKGQAEAIAKQDSSRQSFSKGPEFGGKVVATAVNDRWAADLIDQKASRGRDGETAILIVQDIFSRKLFARALHRKTAQETADAFEEIISEGGAPRELTTDKALEWTGAFAELVEREGIARRYKPVGDAFANDIATLDNAIGNVRSALGRTRAGKDWPSKLQGIIDGYNETPHSGVMNTQPSDVKEDKSLRFALKSQSGLDQQTSAQFYTKHHDKLREAGAARRLVETGPFPRRRAGTAMWGEFGKILNMGPNVVRTTQAIDAQKAFKPAAAPPDPTKRIRTKQRG